MRPPPKLYDLKLPEMPVKYWRQSDGALGSIVQQFYRDKGPVDIRARAFTT
jgi:hypothetical protein